MIINSISLKNFISHANTNIDFPMGVSLIVGPNGSGKSAVIDGILYALLGEKVRGDSIDDLIREGNNEAEVSLNFQLGGLNYNVRRSRQKSMSPTAILQVNQKMIARSHSAVTKELLKFLSLDKETIMNSIFIRQGEIAGLIDADPAKRKETIGKLIGLERLEKAYKNMRKLIRHFEEESQQFIEVRKELYIRNESMVNLDNDIKNERSEITQILKKIKQTTTEVKDAKKEFAAWKIKEEKFNEISNHISILNESLKAKNEKIDDLVKNINEAESAKEEMQVIEPKIKNIESLENIIKISTERNTIEETVKNYKKELEKVNNLTSELKENQEDYKRYLERNEELTEFRKQLEKSHKEEGTYIEISTKITNMEEKVAESNSLISKIEEKALKVLEFATLEARNRYIEKLGGEILNLESNISNLQDEIGNAKGRLNEIDEYIQILGDGNECPVCHTKLTEDHRHKVHHNFTTEKESKSGLLIDNKNQVKKLEKEKKELKIQLDQGKELQIDILDQNRNKLNELTPTLKSLKAQLNEKEIIIKEIITLKSNINEFEKVIEQLRNSYEKYIAAERSLKQERTIESLESDINEKNTELKNLNDSLSSITTKLGKIPEDPEKELKLLREINNRYEVLKSKSQDLVKFNEVLIENKRKLKTIKKNRDSLKKELDELQYDKNIYEKVQEDYNEISKSLSQLENTRELKVESINKRDEERTALLEIIKKLNVELKDLEKITTLIRVLNEIRGAFSKDGIQKFIRKKIAPIITEITREYLDYFNLDITDISINEDFDILIYGRSGEISVKSISGGEKVAVAIALRLAIAKAISGRISTIIMDEPTTHLDEERRRELVKIMNNFLRETSSLPQMIIVTHHQELEDLADTIYRVKKTDNVSKVKEI